MEENLYQVSQEAMNLLIKNSQATELKVQFSSDYDSIVVEISNNGIGLDQIGEMPLQTCVSRWKPSAEN